MANYAVSYHYNAPFQIGEAIDAKSVTSCVLLHIKIFIWLLTIRFHLHLEFYGTEQTFKAETEKSCGLALKTLASTINNTCRDLTT